MENSTKAIIIAAAVLIAIIIIALGVMVVKSSRNSAEYAQTVGESIEDTTDKALNKMREQRIARQNGGSLNPGNGGGGSLNPESGGTGGGSNSIGQGNETLLSIITQIKNAGYYCGANTTQAETLLNNPSTIVKDSPNIMTIVFAGGSSNYSPSVLNSDNCALVGNPLDFSNIEEIIRHFNNHPTRQFDAFLSYDNSMIGGMTIVYYSG